MTRNSHIKSELLAADHPYGSYDLGDRFFCFEANRANRLEKSPIDKAEETLGQEELGAPETFAKKHLDRPLGLSGFKIKYDQTSGEEIVIYDFGKFKTNEWPAVSNASTVPYLDYWLTKHPKQLPFPECDIREFHEVLKVLLGWRKLGEGRTFTDEAMQQANQRLLDL